MRKSSCGIEELWEADELKEMQETLDRTPEYREKVESYTKRLEEEKKSLEYSRERLASATGRSRGYWVCETRRAEGAVTRCQEKLKLYTSLLEQSMRVTGYHG